MTAEAVFVSNRIVSESNRIERFLHIVNRKSNRNQFDLTALGLLNEHLTGLDKSEVKK